MRAWVRRRCGSPDSALELATIPTPPVPTGQSSDVLIRVSHVSLQYSSEMLIRMMPSIPLAGPWIPEIELSGEVVAAGGGAPSELRDPGTPVVAFQNKFSTIIMGHGTLSEYIRLPGCQVTRIDAAVDKAAASGINGSGSTALEMIRTGGVREGHTVLVNGASGSVGSLLVQLCRIRGAKVVGVASGANEAMVRDLGVDEFVDYREHDSLPEYLAHQYGDKPFDCILDCVGSQALFVHSPTYLKAEGMVVNIGTLESVMATARNVLSNMYLPKWLGGIPRRYIMFSATPTSENAVYIARLVEESRLRIPVDSVFDMEDAVDAYARIATKRARGKVVIQVRSD
ncbi:NAD(P)-binding protein [Aspergillus sclerotioniger CBS 115572]|uniref:NAD(P)-binding protein n=1 Tax=Aspergillus sclerotioniger CBS 115572 TaxID=1450535 RepID=A0A317XCY5_9EURO|nr:NAD(P)-binding protein [Aspergillus sclerotioniger CBS 115572]PWY95991.1 NAD(P)-binding protein [Aspergillus sclerotioniger CBS 115572]